MATGLMVIMDQETEKRFAEQGEKLDAIWHSVERVRQYLFWTFVITVIMIALPLIGILFVIPMFLKQYSGLL